MNDGEYITGVARTVHEANRAWNIALGDSAPDGPWDVLPDWHQRQIITRVLLIIDCLNLVPETDDDAVTDKHIAALIHGRWVDDMLRRGWQLGKVKDPAGSPPTHPCLKSWSECPREQQVKDTLAIGIVRGLRNA